LEIFENILRKKEKKQGFGTEFTRFRRLALAGHHQIAELDFLRRVGWGF
jgi:hypothetical protein